MPTADSVMPPRDPAEETAGSQGADPNESAAVVDVVALDAEADKPPVVEKPGAPADWWKVAEEEFDGEDEAVKAIADKFTPDHVRGLDPLAKSILRAGVGEVKKERAAIAAERAAIAREKAEADAKTEADRKALALEQAKFRQLATSPEMRKLLDTPEDQLPDPLSPEGQAARIKKAVAEQFRPFAEDAAKAEREARFLQFQDENPWSRDPGIKAEALKLVQSGQAPDAFAALKLARANKILAEDAARSRVAASRRAEAATHVQRTTTPSSPTNPTIPADVRKNPAKLYAYLERNPDARAAYERDRLAARGLG